MTIRIVDGLAGGIGLKTFAFSGGEQQVQIQRPELYTGCSSLRIVAHLHSSDDIMQLFLATDALRRSFGHQDFDLVVPYFPYARQDRVCAPGEAASARVMCDLINAQKYRSVEVWDAHSDVVPMLLDRCFNRHCADFVSELHLGDENDTILVAPDAGAAKKVLECARRLELPLLTAGKNRNPNTGEITGTWVDSRTLRQNEDRDFLIVDDICDGGRTFVELAKALKPLTTGNVSLYVTHGIFSKGLAPFHGLIQKFYSANIWPSVAWMNIEQAIKQQRT